MKATTLPIANCRYLKSARFMSGSRPCADIRFCHQIKARNETPAPASSNVACSGESPRSATSPFNKHSVPMVPRPSPRQSRLPARAATTPPGAVVGTKRYASAIDAMQNGTTMKKIERQPNRSTSTPPMLGPIAGASTTPIPKRPLARPCSCGSKALRMMMAGIGCTTPAASPSATRATSTSEKLSDRPPARPPSKSSTIVPT